VLGTLSVVLLRTGIINYEEVLKMEKDGKKYIRGRSQSKKGGNMSAMDLLEKKELKGLLCKE
jgi:hypothetical protein